MEGASILNQYSPAKRELVQVGIFPQSHCELTKAIALVPVNDGEHLRSH